MKEPNTAYIGLGSNQGNRLENLMMACEEIKEFAEMRAHSNIYETEPLGHTDQEDFLNMAVCITTELTPLELLMRMQEVEHKLGRIKNFVNGPRLIDLDILLYNEDHVTLPHLTIPHPRLHTREFVLKPLQELAPHLLHPLLKKTISTLENELSPKERVTLFVS